MSSFKKADPKQAVLKIGMYGPPGSGKTFTALLIAEGLAKKANKRVAYIDTEHGTDFYAKAVRERVVHPEAFDFDALYTRSLSEAIDAVESIDLNTHGVLVLDSMSHMWDAAIGAYEGKMTKIDTIPSSAWGKIKKPYKQRLMQKMLDLPIHLILLGRQKNEFEKDEKGDLVKVGVAMRAEGETEYEPHISVRMEAMWKKDGTQSGVVMIVEKDRSGILQGRTFTNPDFSTFEPILPYLGEVQATSEDPEEVAAKDGELLAGDEAKAREKQDKSLTIFNDLNAKIIGAVDMNALATVAAEVKKQKRYLNTEHYAALGQVYTNRNKELSAKLAPTEV